MYEMVTGRVPFDADTPVSVALKHMQEEPEEPIELNPNLPSAVNKIIMKALKKDTTLRYQTATDMLADLRQALKNPNGDFVDDNEYDATARTQKINTDLYGNIDVEDNNKKGKKDNKFVAFVKRHKVLSAFIGLILLFTISLGGTLAFLNITNPPEVQLPDVVGMSKEEAQKTVEDLKLVFEVSSEEYNKDVPEGYVISQDPSYIENYNVKEGSTIKVVISKGQEKTTVPKVVGMTREEAEKALEEANLEVEVVEETSRTVEEGYVISQEVEANSEAYAGDTITIHVSTGTGIKQVTVQNVVGQTEANAKATLEGQGLKVTVNYVDATSDDGKGTKQSVTGGTTVDEGTTVTLTVNKVTEDKKATVTINVKSITGGYQEKSEEDDETTVVKNVKIELKVDDNTVYTDSGVDKNTTNKTTEISGKGSVKVTLVITDTNGGNWTRTQTINLDNTSSLSFS
mgnify:CR=1 FL=1